MKTNDERTEERQANKLKAILDSLGNSVWYPLPLWVYPIAWKKLPRFLGAYTVLRSAHHLNENPQWRKELMKLSYPEQLPTGFNPKNPIHRVVGHVMVQHELEGGSMKYWQNKYDSALRFLEEDDLEEGQPNATIALELFDGLSQRDLSVLQACNSCFGKKGLNIINWKTISRRAVGAKDETTLRKLQKVLGKENIKPLTRWQVQRALGKLQGRSLIRRILLNKRTTFACRGTMPKEELEEKVIQFAERRWTARKATPAFRSKDSKEVTFGDKDEAEDWDDFP